MTWIGWQQFLVLGRSPTWDKGRQEGEPMCLTRKRDRTAFPWCPVCITDWIYRARGAAAACQRRGGCQEHLTNRWWEPPLMEPALRGCLETLGKFKAHTAHFVWKEQITYPKAESLLPPATPISFFSSPAVSSDLVLLFLLLQTSVLCLDCCSEQLKYIYPTLRTAHFDSSQWDTKAEINT